MIYVLLGIIILLCIAIIYLLWDITMNLCTINTHTDRTYDIISRYTILYVSEEYNKGNNKPFDFIYPNDREKIEKKIGINNE